MSGKILHRVVEVMVDKAYVLGGRIVPQMPVLSRFPLLGDVGRSFT